MVVRRSAKRSLACVCAIAFASFWVNAEPKPLNRLSALDVTEDARTTTINVQLMNEPTFTVFRLDNPDEGLRRCRKRRIGQRTSKNGRPQWRGSNGHFGAVERRTATDRESFELELNALYSVRGWSVRSPSNLTIANELTWLLGASRPLLNCWIQNRMSSHNNG